MGFKFSSAAPHPPTHCATGDIFSPNLKVGAGSPSIVLGLKGLRVTIGNI